MEPILYEAYVLKQDIEQKTKRLRFLNGVIAGKAEYGLNKRTGSLIEGSFIAKVTKNIRVNWDSDKLLVASKLYPGNFSKSFKTEYSPISQKKLNTECENNLLFFDAVAMAKIEIPYAPTVKVEPLGDMSEAIC